MNRYIEIAKEGIVIKGGPMAKYIEIDENDRVVILDPEDARIGDEDDAIDALIDALGADAVEKRLKTRRAITKGQVTPAGIFANATGYADAFNFVMVPGRGLCLRAAAPVHDKLPTTTDGWVKITEKDGTLTADFTTVRRERLELGPPSLDYPGGKLIAVDQIVM